jgi:replicative DNA helicase
MESPSSGGEDVKLYRDDYYYPDSERPGEMDIIVRKNRQGRLGHVTTVIDSRLRYLPIERTP